MLMIFLEAISFQRSAAASATITAAVLVAAVMSRGLSQANHDRRGGTAAAAGDCGKIEPTMRCVVYDHRAPAGVRMSNCPCPSAAAPHSPPQHRRSGTVLCAVRAASVNPVDAKYIVGDKLGASLMPRVARLVSGTVPGFDFSGVVIDAPAGSGWKVGDEVFGLADDPAGVVAGKFRGSFAERVEAPPDQIARKPPSLSHEEAAALPLVGVTALQLFDQHGLKRGQRVLIIGASGGVGHVAVQLAARGIGADVTAICSTKNAKWVEECGAKTVIRYDDDDSSVVERLATSVATEGAFDLVVDTVHSADPRDSNISYHKQISSCMDPPLIAPASGGIKNNYVVLGGYTRHWLMAGLKRVAGMDLFRRGALELFWIRMPGSANDLERLAEFAENGQLKPRLAQIISFDEKGVRMAFKTLRGRRVPGKVIIRMNEQTGDTK